MLYTVKLADGSTVRYVNMSKTTKYITSSIDADSTWTGLGVLPESRLNARLAGHIRNGVDCISDWNVSRDTTDPWNEAIERVADELYEKYEDD